MKRGAGNEHAGAGQAAAAGGGTGREEWTLPVVLGLLWLQLWLATSHSWLHGEYYAYGWYVPPVAAWFFARRWREFEVGRPVAWRSALAWVLCLVPLLTVLRVVERVDMRWTAPLWAHALLVAGVTHGWVARVAGFAASRSLVPVTLFALSAVPLPTSAETWLVARLTDTVIEWSAALFNLAGRPVEVAGDRLQSLGEVVQVTEGCSGIRSLQSFLMAGLFFGEWQRLGWVGRSLMVVTGVMAAVGTNVARAMVLAWIRFEHGEAASARAHDEAGLAAYVAGAVLMLAVSGCLANDGRFRGRTVRRRWGGGMP